MFSHLKSKLLIIIVVFFVSSFRGNLFNINTYHKHMNGYNEQDILDYLDNTISRDLFFIDFENGYIYPANSKLHLYASNENWGIVFEQAEFNKQDFSFDITIVFLGSSINVEQHPLEYNDPYTDNTNFITVRLSQKDLVKKSCSNGLYISNTTKEISIRGQKIKMNHNIKDYIDKGIKINSEKGIHLKDFLRYLSATNNEIINATEEECRALFLDTKMNKIMTINEWYFRPYDFNHQMEENMPSKYETFRLIAKILVSRDKKYWKPKLKPNSHWSNWPDAGQG